jgi:TfoX/Sxy family transcriptional regulator of competence genes
MAYDEAFADRVRTALNGHGSLSERKMFGGLCFMLNGNMCAGVQDKGLMLRVGPGRFEAALARPGARPMDFTGRAMKGFLYVDREACETDAELESWLGEAAGFVETLPPKQGSKPMRARKGR